MILLNIVSTACIRNGDFHGFIPVIGEIFLSRAWVQYLENSSKFMGLPMDLLFGIKLEHYMLLCNASR